MLDLSYVLVPCLSICVCLRWGAYYTRHRRVLLRSTLLYSVVMLSVDDLRRPFWQSLANPRRWLAMPLTERGPMEGTTIGIIPLATVICYNRTILEAVPPESRCSQRCSPERCSRETKRTANNEN